MHVLTSAGTTTIYGSSGIGGVGLAVTFPPGVSVKTDPAGAVDSSAVVLSGVVTSGSAFLLPPVYTAATSTSPGRLDLVADTRVGSQGQARDEVKNPRKAGTSARRKCLGFRTGKTPKHPP
jgi:hypothetical protein